MNWYLNLLVCKVIEREIKTEKVQMKPHTVEQLEILDQKDAQSENKVYGFLRNLQGDWKLHHLENINSYTKNFLVMQMK